MADKDEQKIVANDGQSVKPEQSTADKTTNSATKTEQPSEKPDWLVKTEKLQEAVKQGLGAQVVWKSDETTDCEPQLIGKNQASTTWPTVVEEPPKEFRHPKFVWYGSFRGWIENDVVAQGRMIEQLKKSVDQLNDYKTTAIKQSDQNNQQVTGIKTMMIGNSTMMGQVLSQMTKFGKALSNVDQELAKLTTAKQVGDASQPETSST